MLIIKFFSFEEFALHTYSYWNRKQDYKTKFYMAGGEHSDFHNLLCGNAWEEDKFPPFRDAESKEIIRKCNNAEFLEGEWYAMITPFGKTCLEACCGSVRYGLTVIDNSRKGIYTEMGSAGDDVWQFLAELDMDILIGMHSKNNYFLPSSLPVVVKDYEDGGVVQDVLYLGKADISSIPRKYQSLRRLEFSSYYELVYITYQCFEYREKGNKIWAIGLEDDMEIGSLEYVLGELCNSGLHYSYSVSGEKNDVHGWEGVLRALVLHPKQFSIVGYEEEYSNQEIAFINRIQAILNEEEKAI